MSGLMLQIQDFFQTLALGILAGLIFHYYQSTVRRARIGKYPLYVLDFFLWIIMICLVFFAMLWINQGEMRLYVLIALVIGVLIYYYYFSKYLKNLVEASANGTMKLVKIFVKGFKIPIIWSIGLLKSIKNNKKTPPPDDEDI